MKGRLLVAVKSIDLSKEIFGQKKKKKNYRNWGKRERKSGVKSEIWN